MIAALLFIQSLKGLHQFVAQQAAWLRWVGDLSSSDTARSVFFALALVVVTASHSDAVWRRITLPFAPSVRRLREEGETLVREVEAYAKHWQATDPVHSERPRRADDSKAWEKYVDEMTKHGAESQAGCRSRFGGRVEQWLKDAADTGFEPNDDLHPGLAGWCTNSLAMQDMAVTIRALTEKMR